MQRNPVTTKEFVRRGSGYGGFQNQNLCAKQYGKTNFGPANRRNLSLSRTIDAQPSQFKPVELLEMNEWQAQALVDTIQCRKVVNRNKVALPKYMTKYTDCAKWQSEQPFHTPAKK